MIQLKKYFKFDERNAIWKKEIIGGLTTFLAVCYILAVNPALVGNAIIDPLNSAAGTAAQYAGGLFLATAISSFIGTMLMGLWGRVPIALAPGMGLNVFFAYTIASQVGFESALTVTIISGIIYFIVVMTPAREFISKQIPHNYKIAVGAAIGFFIAYLGVQNSGIIVKDPGPALISTLGNFGDPLVIVAICLVALGLILHYGNIPGGILITMIIGAFIIIILSTTGVINKGQENYGLLSSYNDFESFGYVASAGWKGFANISMWKNPITYIGILSFVYMDFFDTTGSLIVINRMIKLEQTDKNWIGRANQVDAVSTIIGAGIGATTVTTFVESTVGVASGAKTGIASVVTALCFALSIAAWPILKVFMPIASEYGGVFYQPITSPILIIIGAIMIGQIKYFEWEIAVDIPTLFITILSMMLTNSIAHGMSFGMIIFVLLNASLGLIQKIKHKKNVINRITIPAGGTNDLKMPTREYHYLKRLNVTCLVVAAISVIYIVLEMGHAHGGWF